MTGLAPYKAREMAADSWLEGQNPRRELGRFLPSWRDAFLACDGITMEINPLVVTQDEVLIGLDARVEIEDEAVYRQRERLVPLGELTMTAAGRSADPAGT